MKFLSELKLSPISNQPISERLRNGSFKTPKKPRIKPANSTHIRFAHHPAIEERNHGQNKWQPLILSEPTRHLTANCFKASFPSDGNADLCTFIVLPSLLLRCSFYSAVYFPRFSHLRLTAGERQQPKTNRFVSALSSLVSVKQSQSQLYIVSTIAKTMPTKLSGCLAILPPRPLKMDSKTSQPPQSPIHSPR